jgi:hypothetical protein
LAILANVLNIDNLFPPNTCKIAEAAQGETSRERVSAANRAGKILFRQFSPSDAHRRNSP